MAPTDSRRVRINLLPRSLAAIAGGIAAVLVALGAATIVLRFQLGHDYGFGLIRKFDLDRELNVPTWFSSSLLLTAALLLLMTALEKRAARDTSAGHWLGLAALFCLMSLDEAAGVHGLASPLLRAAFDLPPALHFAWVIPAGVLVIGVALVYARFTWRLPPRTRRLFVLAGLVYVSGAMGGELVAGLLQANRGTATSLFAWVSLVEEACEMAGTVTFCYAILDYLRRDGAEFRVRFDGGSPADSRLGA